MAMRRWWKAAAAMTVLVAAGACGSDSGGGSSASWVDGESHPFCDSWSRKDVEVFIAEPRLTEHRKGADFCVWDSKAHVTSGSATAAIQMRAYVTSGTETYDRLAAATGKVTDTFDGPQGPVVQAEGVYMAVVDGNTYYVSAPRGRDWDDARESQARKVLIAALERYAGS